MVSILGLALLHLTLGLLCGCASPPPLERASARRFEFARDTFTYANELVWEYSYDPNGKWTTRPRHPKPSYSQHCFVVSRSAYQFFQNAVFDPERPRADETTYRRLIRRLVSTNPRKPLASRDKIVFPGYADLRSFSGAYENLLKSECGGAWRCYVQRGNWRIIFPFSRRQQERVAEKLQKSIEKKALVVVHVVRFPQLSINHAVLMFDAKATLGDIRFFTYDPNEPAKPIVIAYDRATRTFSMAPNAYFPGGRVDVYEIYDRWDY